jgi:hypothetical protein
MTGRSQGDQAMWTRSLAGSIVLPVVLASLPLGATAPPHLAAPVPDVAPTPARSRIDLPACSDLDWLALVPDVKTLAKPAGLQQDKPCPPVNGWRATPLFDRPRDLPHFCRYTWASPPTLRPDRAPSRPGSRDIDRLTGTLGLRATVRRCAVLAPNQAISPQSALDPELLHRELRFQVGATDLPLPAGEPPKIRRPLARVPRTAWTSRSSPTT